MSFAPQISALFWKFHQGVMRRVEAELHVFAFDTERFIYQLLQDGMPADWREQLTAHLARWEQQGPGIIVRNRAVLEAYIISWADAQGLVVDGAIRSEIAQATKASNAASRVNRQPELRNSSTGTAETVLDNTAHSPGVVSTGSSLVNAISSGFSRVVAASLLAAQEGDRPPRLPKTEGHWDGAPGNSHWIPDKPIKIPDGRKVTRVPYVDGLPVFDEWEYKIGDKPADVLIAITGEQRFDQDEALKAWRAKFPGDNFPTRHQFHHDLNATQLITPDGKQVFVARMHLVPKELNEVPHFVAAGAARRYTLDKGFARFVNQQAREGKGLLKEAEAKLRRVLAKRIKQAGRLLPIVGGVFVLIDFAENAEAHGIGGAIIRTTPLLGDIVTAYDAGSEFAAAISEEAKRAVEEAYRDANAPVEKAHADAREETVRALNAIAQEIRVTKYVDENGLIDAMKEPLSEFYSDMLIAFIRMRRGLPIGKPSDAEPTEDAFEARLRKSTQKLKQELRERLSQPPTQGPAA